MDVFRVELLLELCEQPRWCESGEGREEVGREGGGEGQEEPVRHVFAVIPFMVYVGLPSDPIDMSWTRGSFVSCIYIQRACSHFQNLQKITPSSPYIADRQSPHELTALSKSPRTYNI